MGYYLRLFEAALLLLSGSLLLRTNAQTVCSGVVDLFYLLDISGTICDNDPNFVYSRDNTCNNWKSITGFVYNMTSRLAIGPNRVRVGLATFGDLATLEWGLNTYLDMPSLLQAINNLQYFKGQVTNTSGGLLLVDNQFVNTSRPGAARICIIITDGKPTFPDQVPSAIATVHNDSIKTYVVGVTDSIDINTLKLLSSDPKQINVTYFIASDYKTINTLPDQVLSQTACKATTVESLTNSESTFTALHSTTLTSTALHSGIQSTTEVDSRENNSNSSGTNRTVLIVVLVTIGGLILVIVVLVIVVVVVLKKMKKQRTQTGSHAGLHTSGSRESVAPERTYTHLDRENNSSENSNYETLQSPQNSNYEIILE